MLDEECDPNGNVQQNHQYLTGAAIEEDFIPLCCPDDAASAVLQINTDSL